MNRSSRRIVRHRRREAVSYALDTARFREQAATSERLEKVREAQPRSADSQSTSAPKA